MSNNLIIIITIVETIMPHFKVLYEDKDVLINEGEIHIKYYFFPVCTPKIVPLKNIKNVEYAGLNHFEGGGKLWGMSATKWGYWFAGDLKRLSRDHYIAIETGSWVRKAFTTENHRQVYEIIYKLWKDYQNQE